MRILSIVAVALNILWLIIDLLIVFSQAAKDFDIIGYTALALFIVIPSVNLIVLLNYKKISKSHNIYR